MAIVITPMGELMDDKTGRSVPIPEGLNPVDFPMITMDEANAIRTTKGAKRMASTREEDMMRMQRMLDPESVAREGEIRAIEGARSRENIPANMDMGMDSEMPVPMSVVDQVNALMQMGLTEDEALEAIAIERSAGQIQPQDFGQAGQEQQMQQMERSGQMGGTMQPMQPMPNRMVNPGMGALSGVPSGNERPMTMPTPRPEDLMMRQMQEGRTYNPRDAINPYNAPNT